MATSNHTTILVDVMFRITMRQEPAMSDSVEQSMEINLRTNIRHSAATRRKGQHGNHPGSMVNKPRATVVNDQKGRCSKRLRREASNSQKTVVSSHLHSDSVNPLMKRAQEHLLARSTHLKEWKTWAEHQPVCWVNAQNYPSTYAIIDNMQRQVDNSMEYLKLLQGAEEIIIRIGNYHGYSTPSLVPETPSTSRSATQARADSPGLHTASVSSDTASDTDMRHNLHQALSQVETQIVEDQKLLAGLRTLIASLQAELSVLRSIQASFAGYISSVPLDMVTFAKELLACLTKARSCACISLQDLVSSREELQRIISKEAKVQGEV